MVKCSLFGAVAITALAALLPAQAAAPPAADGLVEVRMGYVVGGVDDAGHVLIAVDYVPEDRVIDEVFVYTQRRPVRSWSFEGIAALTIGDSELDIASETATTRFRLRGRERFLAAPERDGRRGDRFTGLSILRRPGHGALIPDFDTGDPRTWPRGLRASLRPDDRFDLFAKQRPGGHACWAGGEGSLTCSYTCGDDAADKCTNPRAEVGRDTDEDGVMETTPDSGPFGPYVNTNCSVSVVADTFGTRGGAQASDTQDTQALCEIDLAELGGGPPRSGRLARCARAPVPHGGRASRGHPRRHPLPGGRRGG